MADIGASNWDETDANNDDASPDGFPEGMAPSGVNNGARAMMGATKRFWNRINAVKTTGGTSSAYTLSYDVAPAAYVNGEIFSFVVNAANAANATLNVNSLGAKALRLFGGNLLAGALLADQIVQARYNSSAGAFDIIPQNGWVRLGEQDPSGATAVTFQSVPSGVNHLRCEMELAFSSSGAGLILQTYGADGVLDTGATDYLYTTFFAQSDLTSGVSAVNGVGISLAGSVGMSTSRGYLASVSAANIQASTFTKFLYQFGYYSSGANQVTGTGTGYRGEADRITGFAVTPSAGNVTGKVTLFASA